MTKLKLIVAAAMLSAAPLLASAAITTTVTDQGKSDFAAGTHRFANAYATGQANTVYTVGTTVTNGGNVYELTAAMSGNSTTAPTGTTTSTDNSGTWTYREAASTYKIVLIKSGMAGTYGSGTKVYADITGNSDEIGNTSTYSAGGVTITGLTVTVASSHAQITFSSTTIASATISAAGACLINSSKGNRVLACYDFGGTQASTAANFTLTYPANLLALN